MDTNRKKIIMCLYPKLMKNPRYLPNKKNGYNPPTPTDSRVKYVAVGCGNCIECRTQKARMWQIRLINELENNKFAYFITLTFSNESFLKLIKECETTADNALLTIAMRRFLERWRKKYKKSLKHWFISELGHNGTERIHAHGIIYSDKEITKEELEGKWQYGFIYVGDYCNNKTINYMIKYVNKVDNDHKNYKSIILCSAGLGKNYVNEGTKQLHRYKPKNTIEYITLPNGSKVNMPIYYKNKFLTENEREMAWLDRLDNNTIYVRGIEVKNIDTKEGNERYLRILKAQQEINKSLGYGSDENEWKAEEYNVNLKMLNRRTLKKKT